MGETGSGEGNRSPGLNAELADSALIDVAGINVYVAIVRFPRNMVRDQVKRMVDEIPPEVIIAVATKGKLSLCKAALAYIYTLEDKELDVVRVRDDNIRFLMYLVKAKQVRDAIKAAEPLNAAVLASLHKDPLEKALHRLGIRSAIHWRRGITCNPLELEEITAHRLQLLFK